jgi:hypothetical protein
MSVFFIDARAPVRFNNLFRTRIERLIHMTVIYMLAAAISTILWFAEFPDAGSGEQVGSTGLRRQCQAGEYLRFDD